MAAWIEQEPGQQARRIDAVRVQVYLLVRDGIVANDLTALLGALVGRTRRAQTARLAEPTLSPRPAVRHTSTHCDDHRKLRSKHRSPTATAPPASHHTTRPPRPPQRTRDAYTLALPEIFPGCEHKDRFSKNDLTRSFFGNFPSLRVVQALNGQ